MDRAIKQPAELPKYVQISELIIRDINAGRLMDGERLPPEKEMADTLGISVGTLRKALTILADKKLVQRVQGSGNYIRHGAVTESVYSMFRLELHEGGGLPRAVVLDVCVLPMPEHLPPFGRAEHVTRIRRLRFLNETVIAVEEIWLDGAAGQVPDKGLPDSLYHFYQHHLGFWITRAEDRVGIDVVPEWGPSQFGKAAGEVTGYIERFSWAHAPEAIEFSRTWYDPDVALYVQRLK